MTATYLSGSLVRVSVAFTDVTGAPADPTTVTLTYQPGYSAPVVVAYPGAPVLRDSAGAYHADLDTTGSQTEVWGYEWAGTGTVQAVTQGSFQVQRPLAQPAA